jgi:exoribonuclease-2
MWNKIINFRCLPATNLFSPCGALFSRKKQDGAFFNGCITRLFGHPLSATQNFQLPSYLLASSSSSSSSSSFSSIRALTSSRKKKKKKKSKKSLYSNGKDDGKSEKEGMTKKSTVLPGEVTLDRETWVHEMKDTVVEYNDGLGHRELGLVQRPVGKRYWAIIDEKGIEREINIYQISFQWPTPLPSVPSSLSQQQQQQQQIVIQSQNWVSATELHKYREYALELLQKQQVDAHAVWRHFLEKNEDRLNAYLVAKFIFHTKKPSAFQLYAAHLFLCRNEVYFQSNAHSFRPRNEESVKMIRLQMENERKEEEARQQFVEKLRRRLEMVKYKKEQNGAESNCPTKQTQVGEQVEKENEREEGQKITTENDEKSDGEKRVEILFNPEYDPIFLSQIKDYALSPADAVESETAQMFLKPLGYGTRPRDAFQLLVDLEVWTPYANPHLLRWRQAYGSLDFSPTDYKMAEQIAKSPPEDPDALIRCDMTKIPVFTIDTEKGYEVDDGLSVVTDEHGDDWLYIHIADPTRYIHPQSHLDRVARERVSSIFLPDRVFPLFPPILSKRLFSLLPNKRTCVISFGVKLGPDGSIEKYRIVPAMIERVIPLTSEELDSILFGRSGEPSQQQQQQQQQMRSRA